MGGREEGKLARYVVRNQWFKNVERVFDSFVWTRKGTSDGLPSKSRRGNTSVCDNLAPSICLSALFRFSQAFSSGLGRQCSVSTRGPFQERKREGEGKVG